MLRELLGKSSTPPPLPGGGDAILGDLLRGEEGRRHGDSHSARNYFERPELIAQAGFQDGAGDNFLGIIGGKSERVKRTDGRVESITRGGVPIGSKDDRHRTLVAGSRSGKGRCVLIPELLTYGGSMIVLDVKGENAAITARWRAQKLGQQVCILDPFQITPAHCSQYRARYNPLSILDPLSLTLVEDAGLIADALIVAQNSKDSHWDETAKAFIEGVILHVACGEFSPDERNLVTVAELIAGKQGSLNLLLDEMEEAGGPDNRVAAAARMIRDMGDNERGSVLSNARKNLKFLDYDAMQASLSGHDFNLSDLKTKPLTIYLVLPATRMATCRQWLRLFVNMTLAAIEKSPARPKYAVQMILDEMPVLGHMKELESAIGQMAGLGLRITSVLQDLGQLKAIYKDRFETFLGNSGILQFFGNVDFFTSEWISKYLGSTTIRVEERGANSIDARSKGASGSSFRNHIQELMTPEEVRRFFARDDHYNRQLVCIPGKRPFILQRANYDQHELFRGRFDVWQS
ncbi:type IV secretory system conjugative DNA transfer family protein [Luteolibacter pohnpeiensis]|uniref:Type IV secretory system conjugative DNA transfer family protein n=1 Tax=Luteolibacter pohnpeiensis TaxID=454153 RepID=A0A934VRS9_9BACT|nr:type IV secretory system conjugative DNA transfer family protein [Luteolibacter pohnpeiensis]MBK1883536.1 type IV secretory system conjugative DNA transfer family protein [Luteolibacter pohnpeiensis]